MRVKVSSKNQIAIPAAVRKRLRIQEGDHLLVDLREGSVVLIPEPRGYSQHLRGLHRDVWDGTDPDEYIRREREAWQK
jgi:antitoxin ChpS